jgi:hypothetical protein
MLLYDLSSDEEYSFSHNNIEMAFAFVYAQSNNLMSLYAQDHKKVIERMGEVVVGLHGYFLNNWAIPKTSIQ